MAFTVKTFFFNAIYVSIINAFSYHTISKTWWDADTYCRNQYVTNLVTITDSTMNTDISDTISSSRAWIGYYDAYNEGNFKWVGYNKTSYTYWAPGQPTNGLGNEDCTFMWDIESGGN